MTYPHYWSRKRRFSRGDRAVTLHFTHHPGDLIIRVALANRAAHDIILTTSDATDKELFSLVQQYTKDVTRTDLRALPANRVGVPTPHHTPKELTP